ncbi:rRNA processing protein-related [Zea mays]|jgi:protein AATF/BFR2|uniref:rRNA processing protein-related n=1 Tax=Zea mays TaxID=4577 RepID=A0A1D6LIH7_MAIZE|nr:rRNA processing protein-related [Zea mays]
MMNQHREEDALRGQAVKKPDGDMGQDPGNVILAAEGISTSNKLPQEPIGSRFCKHDKQIEANFEQYDGAAGGFA